MIIFRGLEDLVWVLDSKMDLDKRYLNFGSYSSENKYLCVIRIILYIGIFNYLFRN